ncbi:UDP-N-acetylmuramate dehydrogenase [Candidatus Eisenbacteria bacterium]|uniref:UDP-N-acetylenolpyruvoylglucosamine reductase n=1 Tax=Eiseniibacteriota bacterium TaxID=2212470 RepID=A0ABV6YKY3_UNCEI
MSSNEFPNRWQRDMFLSRLTTWRIGGPARLLSSPGSVEELRSDLAAASSQNLPVFALGGGSNLLVADKGYDGLIVRLPSGASNREPHPETGIVDLPAGASLAFEARRLSRLGWRGLEWAEGIPGTIAGAITNNAGAHGGSIAEILEGVDVCTPDGLEGHWEASRLELSYRHSTLKHNDPTRTFITAGRFRLRKDDPHDLLQTMASIREHRDKTVPHEPSCGCVFKNPPGQSAGKLIDQLGLAGHRSGGAIISPKHANFFLNTGQATASDILNLIRITRDRVHKETGLHLELEVQLLGFPPCAPESH